MAAGVAKPLICLNHSHRHVLGTLSSFKASLKSIHGNHTTHLSEIYTSRFTEVWHYFLCCWSYTTSDFNSSWTAHILHSNLHEDQCSLQWYRVFSMVSVVICFDLKNASKTNVSNDYPIVCPHKGQESQS